MPTGVCVTHKDCGGFYEDRETNIVYSNNAKTQTVVKTKDWDRICLGHTHHTHSCGSLSQAARLSV